MSQEIPHMYPPDGQDSQVAAYIDKLLQESERLEEMKIAYNKELASREARPPAVREGAY
jgi:hypothetical protein